LVNVFELCDDARTCQRQDNTYVGKYGSDRRKTFPIATVFTKYTMQIILGSSLGLGTRT